MICVLTTLRGKYPEWSLMIDKQKVADVDRHDLHRLACTVRDYLYEDVDESITIGTPGGSAVLTRAQAHQFLMELDSTTYRHW